MSQYFEYISAELYSKIQQVKHYINRHNPTTGALAEEVLRQFLKDHLPRSVSVEQGFTINPDGELSRQCDILIYDSHRYAPFYRAGNLVVIPAEAVIAIVEVKTSITKPRFHDVIRYFSSFQSLGEGARTYLFMFTAPKMEDLCRYFLTYPHPGTYKEFDHDTFGFLPDEITGLDRKYHLKKSYVPDDRDSLGYMSYFLKDLKGEEIHALEIFFLSIYKHVETYINRCHPKTAAVSSRGNYHQHKTASASGFGLFPM